MRKANNPEFRHIQSSKTSKVRLEVVNRVSVLIVLIKRKMPQIKPTIA